jgi:hypothetical protein
LNALRLRAVRLTSQLALAVLSILALASAESAVLVASKMIVNNIAAQNQDMIVQYSIYNLGDA